MAQFDTQEGSRGPTVTAVIRSGDFDCMSLNWSTYNKNGNVSTATRFEIPPDPPPSPLPLPSPFDDYLDNMDTMRKAASVPRLLSQGPLLSGKAKARDEIFMRRAKLASELSKMGLPPMVEGLKQGKMVKPEDGMATNPILKSSRANKKSLAKHSGGKAMLTSQAQMLPLEDEPSPPTKVAPSRLLVLGGGDSLTAEGLLASKPYYPKRAPTIVPKNEELGGDLGLVNRFQKDASEMRGGRGAESSSATTSQRKNVKAKGSELPVKGSREERIMKLAACLAAAHDRGIINLGVAVEKEGPDEETGLVEKTQGQESVSASVTRPARVKAEGAKKKVLAPPASGRIEALRDN